MLAGVAWALRRSAAGATGHLALAAMLWVLPAAIFVFTVYPWWLQLYYSHFSVIGLALLLAVAVRSLQGWPAGRPLLRKLAFAAGVLLLGAWMGLGGRTIREGIRLRASPALGEADLAQSAYQRLAPQLKAGQYERVVFLDVLGGDVDFHARRQHDPRLLPRLARIAMGETVSRRPHKRTDAVTLVVRQTSDRALTIVR